MRYQSPPCLFVGRVCRRYPLSYTDIRPRPLTLRARRSVPFAVSRRSGRTVRGLSRAASYDAGKVDGKWGAKTAAALKKFQGDHGLQANGQIDAQTISALGITRPVESSTTGSAASTTDGATSSSEQTASANQGTASIQRTAQANQGVATSSSRSSNTQ